MGRCGTPVHSAIKRLRGSGAGVWGETSRDPVQAAPPSSLANKLEARGSCVNQLPSSSGGSRAGGGVGRSGKAAEPSVEDSGILEGCLTSVQALTA